MNRKIRVAFFADILLEDLDGASRTMYQIINRIPSEQYDFMFFCGIPPRQRLSYKVVSIPTVTIPFNSTYKAALPILASSKIKKNLDKFQPDIIHIASPSPLGNFAIQEAKSRNLPVISIYHTHFLSYVEYYLRYLPVLIDMAKDQVIKKNKVFYESCDKVLIPTNTVKDELGSYGFSTDNMVIWGRGIDHSLFNPNKRNVSKINKITGSDKLKITFASRLVWEKNLKTLIKIYKRIEKQQLPYQMVIVGDGVAKEEMESLMPNAFFFGNVDHSQLSTIYASSHVFCFTSISESYGNVLIEAMSSGLPVVAAAGGGTLSLVVHGENGFLVSPDKPKEYLEAIRLLQEDGPFRPKFISGGLQFTKNLSWDNLVDQYFALVRGSLR